MTVSPSRLGLGRARKFTQPRSRRGLLRSPHPRSCIAPVLCVEVNEPSSFTEDRFYVVAVRIQHEGCVIPGRVAPLAQARRPVVGAPRPQGGGVKRLDLRPALGREGDMLTDRRRVEAIDPEDRVICSIADSVSPFVFGKLHDSPEVQSAQHGVVKGGGTPEVRDADAGVVDQWQPPPGPISSFITRSYIL